NITRTEILLPGQFDQKMQIFSLGWCQVYGHIIPLINRQQSNRLNIKCHHKESGGTEFPFPRGGTSQKIDPQKKIEKQTPFTCLF
ncbi:MAG: hypothetical protein K8S55_08825, partial [Phycisphaerae bacterium]|nr:hypothetical protein [Phycisphaerae bacterium]